MWPSGGDPHVNPKPLSSLSSSSSFSSFSSSSSKSWSPSSSSPASIHHPLPSRTMEEVWKDINLGSLYDHHNPTRDSPRGMTFQDFLARPFSSRDHHHHHHHLLHHHPPSPTPPPATILTLHSGPDLPFFSHSVDHLVRPPSSLLLPTPTPPPPPAPNFPYSLPPPFDVLASPSSGLPSSKKRFPPEPANIDNPSGDRRHKRMIKNRESAARSRARKQAYTNELEQELDNLTKENARLKRQQQELRRLADTAQLSKKHSLQRTSTAPF